MDIMVQGEGKKFYKPNQVDISINFFANDETYEKSLKKGTETVEEFINLVLKELKINREELKTRNFRIYQNIRYDYQTKTQVDNGFDYNQSATLKLDYSMDVISEFMDKVSKLVNPPKYNMTFTIKEQEMAKKEVLEEAYIKAKEKAEAIAKASGKILKDCIKVDFRPFEEKVYSYSSLSDTDLMLKADRTGAIPEKAMKTTKDVLQTIFTPEDVEIRETLYCLWVTE